MRVHTKKPDPIIVTLLNVSQSMIVPERYIKGLTGDPEVAEDSDYDAFALAPVGTGPFKITEFIAGQKLVWERFDGYWGEKPDIRKATITRINEMASDHRSQEGVDIITNVPPDQIATIERDSTSRSRNADPIFHHLLQYKQPEDGGQTFRRLLLSG